MSNWGAGLVWGGYGAFVVAMIVLFPTQVLWYAVIAMSLMLLYLAWYSWHRPVGSWLKACLASEAPPTIGDGTFTIYRPWFGLSTKWRVIVGTNEYELVDYTPGEKGRAILRLVGWYTGGGDYLVPNGKNEMHLLDSD